MASIRRAVSSTLSRNICQQCSRAIPRRSIVQPFSRPQNQHHIQRFIRPTPSAIRWHSAPASNAKVYDFSHIQKLTESPTEETILIDVREPSEYKDGYIPTAINIPVKSAPDALFLPEEEFEDRFGFTKPPIEKEVIFYCRSGVRSSAAAQLAQKHGYQNIAEYRGSWLDWEKQGGKASKP